VPLDPDVAALLETLPPFDPSLSAPEVRAAGARRPAGTGHLGVVAKDWTIPSPHGPIPARHYLPPPASVPPATVPPPSTPGGLLVFFHGGGFVLGGLDSHDAQCRDLSAGSGVGVLAVDYRLAPEHPFPAAVEDAWEAVRWAAAHAEELGADPRRLGVGGDSAGGNLAAVVALMARDAGLAVALQLLVYPVTDFSERRPSYEENGQDYFLTADAMGWFEKHYAADPTDWRASPMLATDHRGVAPATVLTCEYDPLRDEGDDYAALLEQAGVAVRHRCIPGLVHGSLAMVDAVPAARVLMDACCEALREALEE